MRRVLRNKKSVKRFLCLSLATGMLISTSGCVKVEKVDPSVKENEVASTSEQHSREKRDNNDAIRLEDDFFGYVNKSTLDSHKITYKENQVGVDSNLQDEITMEIAALLEQITNAGDMFNKDSSEYVLQHAYSQTLEYLKNPKSSAMDVFGQYYKRIQEAKNIDEISKIISEIANDQGIILYFKANVKENYFDGDSYAFEYSRMESIAGIELKDIYEDEETRKKLHSYAMLLLEELGEDKALIKQKAKDYVYFALDVAEKTDFDEIENGNPFVSANVYQREEIDNMLGDVNTSYIENIYDLNNPYDYSLVEDEEQLKLLASKFNNDNLEVIKTYMICELAMEYKDFLAQDMEVMEQYSNLKAGNNEKVALMYVGTLLVDATSELYQKYNFSEKKQADYQRMFQDIVNSYDELIGNATWLTEETRKGLKTKLHNMVFVSGGGKEITTDNVRIGKDLFETYLNARKWKVTQIKDQVTKKIDRNMSTMSSYEVNAAYNPSNTFTVSVAIGKAPYYAEEASYEENLGGLGMVMGHEIGHAFDSMSLDWDANGKYNPDWICKEDQEKLKKHLADMEEYYSNTTIMNIYHVNGKKTSGENYADVGAMECVTNIIKDKEQRKRLFENYGKIWCNKKLDEDAVSSIKNDTHSPAVVRVNAVLSTSDAFYETYDIKENDGMYVPQDKRVYRWKDTGK